MPLDPDYVNQQMSDDFDPHLTIAEMAGLLTQDEVNFYKVVKEGFDRGRYQTTVLDTMLSWDESLQQGEVKRIAKVRSAGKQANYACLPMRYLINTPEGIKPFEEIQVGDIVWGSDYSGERIPSTVEFKHHYKDADTVGVMMDGTVVWSTLNHRWKKSGIFGGYCTTQDILDNISSGKRTSLDLIPVVKGSKGIYRSHSVGYKDLAVSEVEDVFCLTTSSGNFEIVLPSGKAFLTGNCQYGAGAKTVARSAKVGIDVGKQLVEGYRELNWSIDIIAGQTLVRKTSFGDFQLNPLNKMFYPLKTAKDRFSTLIQGSGSYVLDLWLMFINKRINQAMVGGLLKFRPLLLSQFHDY